MRGLWIVCILAGCYFDKTPKTPHQTPIETRPLRVAEPTRDSELYALDEALADVFSGPLEHIGTGPWFGLFRINACAYRNARVIVVNIYCTTNEMKAFSVVVFSPERGRVVIYAEAEKPISRLKRRDYFTFKAESAPSASPPVSLSFRYDQLTAWDEKRYYKWIPACFGGVEIRNPQGGCLKGLEPHVPVWKARNQPFLDDPPEDWYRVVREMRARALRDGKYISRPGG